MIIFRIACATAIAAAFAVLGVSTPASAYPDVTCHITDPGRACEGETLQLTATVDPDVDCHPISITWNGITREGTGSSLTANFPTSEGDADREELETSSASCTYDDTNEQGEVSQRTVSTTGTVVIEECDDSDDSDDSDDNGGLPDTGGERLLWLLVGLLLVTGGAVVIVTSRREDEAPN